MMAKITTIRAKVLQINVDRTQYKPYSNTLEPQDLWVEMVLPEGSVVEDTKNPETGRRVVITMDGFSVLLGQIADSIDKMHDEHTFKQTGMKRR